ncbi:MAG: VOC family protein [Gemmatimonadaceae bacterium]|nr:VOC family protein [Gemmatimonadaceae bacterium]
MTTGARKTGDFCWINILTPHPGAAREFFGALLGWTYLEIPGMGHRVQVSGRDIGGMFDLDGPNTPPGTPPGIGVMVRVDNADAMVASVNALGGTAQPAFDIGPQGRMADCRDPNGANIDLWQPSQSPGMEADSTLHGAPSWFEARTTNVDGAAAFYTQLFGWTTEVMSMPGAPYTSFKLGNEAVAGMMQITPEMGSMPPHWAVYFTVNDIDATAGDAVARGGSICVPVRDIPGVGRFCGIISPQGVMFYTIQYTAVTSAA